MKIKRRRYSLRNCNPGERRKRDRINRLDFEMNFPYYLNSKSVDLNLLRRFLYKNKIPIYYLYTPEKIQEQLEDREELNGKQEQFFAENYTDPGVKSRFELIDL